MQKTFLEFPVMLKQKATQRDSRKATDSVKPKQMEKQKEIGSVIMKH